MRKIIVVDDVEDNRDFLYYALKPHYQVVRCETGADLLSCLHVERPDLIILDVALPDITGFDVLKAIRHDPQFFRTPVIAVTAHAMKGDRDKCLAAGFTDYVAKPIVDLDEFISGIARHIASIGT